MLISSTPTGNRFVLVWYVQMPFAYEKPSSDFETPGAVQWEGGARRLGSRRFAVNLLVVDVRGHENVTRGGFHHQLVRGEVGAEGGASR
jgi:hypothetical protein